MKGRPSDIARAVGLPVVVAVVALCAWEAVVRGGWVPRYLLPTPADIAACLIRDWRELLHALWITASGALVGFGMSVVIGIGVAVVLSLASWVRQAFYPYAVVLQTVPLIAIAPLLVIYLGPGLPTVRASAFIASVFPIIANTLAGLMSTDPALRDLFRLYGASPWARVFKLRLPSALPSVFVGLRIGAALAVIGAVVGEFLGGGGLGAIVETAKTQLAYEKVYAVVALAAVLGLGLFGTINIVSFLTLRHWHASESE